MNLVEVRCPLKTTKGDKQYDCNKLAVKVQEGTAGVAFCPAHKQEFNFDVIAQNRSEPLPLLPKAQ